jgi:LmbE family N-acetylglucosaminyl deacetylase
VNDTDRGVIVVAPHPDDEVLGASTLLTSGPVTVVYVTDGVPPDARDPTLAAARLAEAREAHRILGATSDVVRFGVADQRVTDAVDFLASRLDELVRERRARDIYIPAYQRGHPDHDATHVAGHLARQRSGRDAPGLRWQVYALYGLTDDGEARVGALGPEYAADLRTAAADGHALDRKARALRAFVSQRPDDSVLALWLRDPVPEQFAGLGDLRTGLPPRRCFYDEVFEFRQFGIDPDAITTALTDALRRAGVVAAESSPN